jgi:hypothetical protein
VDDQVLPAKALRQSMLTRSEVLLVGREWAGWDREIREEFVGIVGTTPVRDRAARVWAFVASPWAAHTGTPEVGRAPEPTDVDEPTDVAAVDVEAEQTPDAAAQDEALCARDRPGLAEALRTTNTAKDYVHRYPADAQVLLDLERDGLARRGVIALLQKAGAR